MQYVKAYLLLLFIAASSWTYSQSFTVSVISPAGSMNFTGGNSMNLVATASHGSTPISTVSFYRGGTTLIGNATLNGSVYTYTWTSVPIGNYSITAKATDNLSNTQTSSAVSISVDSLSILNTWSQGGNSFGTEGDLGTNDNNRLVFKTNGLEKATILPNGNFGLGTSNPQAQLHTTGSVRFGNFLNNLTDDSVLSTDNSGNLIFRNNPALTFDNGLTQSGNEIYAGGTASEYNYDFEILPPDQNEYGNTEDGYLDYSGENGYSYWGMTAESYLQDTLYNSGNLSLLNYLAVLEAYSYKPSSSIYDDAYILATTEGEGSSNTYLTLEVADTANENYAGMNLYSTWMQLNEPSVQLPYYLNNSTEDSVLVTDSAGYLHQKALSSFSGGNYVFDNGLTQNGDEVYAGGVSDNDSYSFVIDPTISDFGTGTSVSGEFQFEQDPFQMWTLDAAYSNNDSISFDTYLGLGLPNFNLESTFNFPAGSSDVDIFGGTLEENAVLGFTVVDTINESNNGLNIYSSWMQLNEPSIQLPYYLNTNTEDSVLVTDSAGYLHQRAISSIFPGDYVFDNGLTQEDNEVFLGGTVSNYYFDLSIVPPDQDMYDGNSFEDAEVDYFGSGGSGAFDIISESGIGDSAYTNSSVELMPGGVQLETYGFNNSLPYSDYENAGLYASTAASGSPFGFLSLFVSDTSNENLAGVNLYSTWMSLNESSIQLPYYLNNSTGDSVLVTDSAGYLHQKSLTDFLNGGYTFDNGLTQNGSEVYLGGTVYNDALEIQFTPPDEDPNLVSPGMPYETDLMEWDESGGWNIGGSGGVEDSAFTWGANAYIQPFADPFPSFYFNSFENGNNISQTQLYGFSTPEMSILGLYAQDSLNEGGNGIDIYSTGINLNGESISLPYYLNDEGEDSVLVTDLNGNLHQKAFSDFTFVGGGDSYVFDNGLTQNGDEVYAGGTDDYDNYVLEISPEDYSGNEGLLQYTSETTGGDFFMGAGFFTDSAVYYSELDLSSENYLYNLETFNSFGDGTYADVDITGSTGLEGALLDLTVADSLNTAYNGINIFSTWLSLDEPLIQLPYYLNDANQDSVLVTDQNGNLSQKSFASFGTSSRWILNGSNLYDTLDYIGIGTANPQSLLAVAGTITSQKVKVTQTGWSDYVFDSAYTLKPISEVEKFIHQNKHLPDIPSAAEVKKQGIDVGDNQALLLKKIEELTLYVIDQNKELQELKNQNKTLSEQNKKMQDLQQQIDELKKLITLKN